MLGDRITKKYHTTVVWQSDKQSAGQRRAAAAQSCDRLYGRTDENSTKSGKVLVADPASYKRSGQEWDMSIILNEARGDAAAGGPFWAVSK